MASGDPLTNVVDENRFFGWNSEEWTFVLRRFPPKSLDNADVIESRRLWLSAYGRHTPLEVRDAEKAIREGKSMADAQATWMQMQGAQNISALQNAQLSQQMAAAQYTSFSILGQMAGALGSLGGSYGNSQGLTRSAGQGNQREQQREAIPEGSAGEVSTNATQERIRTGKERLSLKNSPMFGEPAFGRWCRWTFDNPLAPLHRWFLRKTPAIQRWAAT